MENSSPEWWAILLMHTIMTAQLLVIAGGFVTFVIDGFFGIYVPDKHFVRAKSRRTGAVRVLTKSGTNIVGWDWKVESPPYPVAPVFSPFCFFVEGCNAKALISGTLSVNVVDPPKYQMSRDDDFTSTLEQLVMRSLGSFDFDQTYADIARLVPEREMELKYGVHLRVHITKVESPEDHALRKLRSCNHSLYEYTT